MRTEIIVGVCCITAIEIVALLKGHNGILLTTMVGAICGLIGYGIPSPLKK